MKKIFRTTTFVAFMAMAATGCQKDNALLDAESNRYCAPIHYLVDGTPHTASLSDIESRDILWNHLFGLVKEGYTVEIHAGNSISSKEKKTVTFTTTSEQEAKSWTKDMVAQGYTVSITLKEGVYTCIAQI